MALIDLTRSDMGRVFVSNGDFPPAFSYAGTIRIDSLVSTREIVGFRGKDLFRGENRQRSCSALSRSWAGNLLHAAHEQGNMVDILIVHGLCASPIDMDGWARAAMLDECIVHGASSGGLTTLSGSERSVVEESMAIQMEAAYFLDSQADPLIPFSSTNPIAAVAVGDGILYAITYTRANSIDDLTLNRVSVPSGRVLESASLGSFTASDTAYSLGLVGSMVAFTCGDGLFTTDRHSPSSARALVPVGETNQAVTKLRWIGDGLAVGANDGGIWVIRPEGIAIMATAPAAVSLLDTYRGAIAYVSGGYAWLMGRSGARRRVALGGYTPIFMACDERGMTFTIVNASGVVANATAYGATWTAIGAVGENVASVVRRGKNLFYALATDGTVYTSLDGGVSWSVMPTLLSSGKGVAISDTDDVIVWGAAVRGGYAVAMYT